MTESPAWQEFEWGDGVLLQLLRFAILGIGIFFLVFAGILELTWPQQAVLGLLTVLLGIWMDQLDLLPGHPNVDALLHGLHLPLRILRKP